MIGRDAVSEQAHIERVQPFPHHGPVQIPIPGKLQEEITVMTAMSNMISHPRHYVSIRSWHSETIDDCSFVLEAENALKKRF